MTFLITRGDSTHLVTINHSETSWGIRLTHSTQSCSLERDQSACNIWKRFVLALDYQPLPLR